MIQLKDPERKSRGMGEKILVKSSKSQLPEKLNESWKNGEN